MAKTLKSILETYAPRSADEKRFIDKHVVVKHSDRNGNGDDVFKGKKIKTVKRAPEHGHEVGKDHEVYEETDSQRYDRHFSKQPDHVQNNLNRHMRNGLSYPDAVAKEVGNKKGATPLHEEAPVDPAGTFRDSLDEDTFSESYDRLHTLKSQMARLQKRHDSIEGIHPQKKVLSVKLAKLKKEHGELFNGQFKEDVDLNESEDDLKGAKKVGAYGDNMTFVIMKKNLAAHAAAESHRLDLARHKRKGIPHPTLGRIPRGADIAGAESRVGQLVHAVRNDMLKEESLVEATATINSPGHRLHGKVGRVFHDHGDGRVNVQITHSTKKGDVTNLTLKKGEYKLNEEALSEDKYTHVRIGSKTGHEEMNKDVFSTADAFRKHMAAHGARPSSEGGSGNSNTATFTNMSDEHKAAAKKFIDQHKGHHAFSIDLKESAEQIDELSNDLLKRYVAKGDRSYDSLNDRAYNAWKDTDEQRERPLAYRKAVKVARKLGAKADRRAHSLNKAEAKLKEETVTEAYPTKVGMIRKAKAAKQARAVANGYTNQKSGKWKAESYKTEDGRWASRDVKEEIEQIDEAAAARSGAFAFTHTPGDADSEEKLTKLKKMVKAHNSTADEHSKLRITARGRLGTGNPKAEKYRKGGEVWNKKARPAGTYDRAGNWKPKGDGSLRRGDIRDISTKDAKHHDIYIHPAPRGWDKPGFQERYAKDPYNKVSTNHAKSLISAHKAICEEAGLVEARVEEISELSTTLLKRYRDSVNKDHRVPDAGNPNKELNKLRKRSYYAHEASKKVDK